LIRIAAYISYHYRATLFVGDTQKALGEMWRNMSEAEKTVCTDIDMFKQGTIQHK